MGDRLTEQRGRRAFRSHLVHRAAAARARYGPAIDTAAFLGILTDRDFVRYPVTIRFDQPSSPELRHGELARDVPLGENPRDGFVLLLHPALTRHGALWPAVLACHIASINYGHIVDPEDCDLFGATLLGLPIEDYYTFTSDVADSIFPSATTEPSA
jgi:hypothetical protein